MHHPHNIIIGFRIQTLHSQVIYLFPRCVFLLWIFFLSLWEQYKLIVEKPKPKWSLRLIITKENVIGGKSGIYSPRLKTNLNEKNGIVVI